MERGKITPTKEIEVRGYKSNLLIRMSEKKYILCKILKLTYHNRSSTDLNNTNPISSLLRLLKELSQKELTRKILFSTNYFVKHEEQIRYKNGGIYLITALYQTPTFCC